MKYCEKCKKNVPDEEDLYRGLCNSCYQDYLIEKIDNSDTNFKEDSAFDQFISSIIHFIRKLFSKK